MPVHKGLGLGTVVDAPAKQLPPATYQGWHHHFPRHRWSSQCATGHPKPHTSPRSADGQNPGPRPDGPLHLVMQQAPAALCKAAPGRTTNTIRSLRHQRCRGQALRQRACATPIGSARLLKTTHYPIHQSTRSTQFIPRTTSVPPEVHHVARYGGRMAVTLARV